MWILSLFMKVLFINPVTPPELFPVKMSMGVAGLSAVLKEKGHATSLVCPHVFSEEKISDKINEFKPDLIAVSSVTDQIKLAEKIISFINDKHKLPIILGGNHATVAPEESININGLFGICIGEGDYALLDLVEALEQKKDYSKIENFWFRINDQIIKNPLRSLVQDLDSLPFPDRSIFDGIIDTKDELEFMGSRGCPYQCSYCINRTLMNVYKDCGKYVRFRSVDNILKEIKEALKKYKTSKILFHDDTFTLDKKWLREFTAKYPKEIGMPYVANGRVETMDEEVVKMLKDSDCAEIKIGVEVGNEKLRKKILNRHMTNEQIINVFSLCKKYGLPATSFNMVGLPYETEENIRETITLNKKIKPLRMGVSVFRPYPGTEIYELCKKKGWISGREIVSYFEDISILDMPQLSNSKITYHYKIFKLAVYHPMLVFFVKFLLKIRLYDFFWKSFKEIRKITVKLLSRKQKDFLQKILKI